MSNYNVKLQLELEHWTGLWYYEIEKLEADPENGYKLLVSARAALECQPVGTTIKLNEHIFSSLDGDPLEMGLTLSGPIPKEPYKFELKGQGTGPVESMKQDQVECDCESCCLELLDFEEKPVIQKSGYEFL